MRSVPVLPLVDACDAKRDHAQNRGMAAEALIPTSPEEAASSSATAADLTVFGGGTILLPGDRGRPAEARRAR